LRDISPVKKLQIVPEGSSCFWGNMAWSGSV